MADPSRFIGTGSPTVAGLTGQPSFQPFGKTFTRANFGGIIRLVTFPNKITGSIPKSWRNWSPPTKASGVSRIRTTPFWKIRRTRKRWPIIGKQLPKQTQTGLPSTFPEIPLRTLTSCLPLESRRSPQLLQAPRNKTSKRQRETVSWFALPPRKKTSIARGVVCVSAASGIMSLHSPPTVLASKKLRQWRKIGRIARDFFSYFSRRFERFGAFSGNFVLIYLIIKQFEFN